MLRSSFTSTREDSRQELIRSSTDGLSALKVTRDRAIENDYCESLHRTASDPFSSAHVTLSSNHARPRRFNSGSRMETRGRINPPYNPMKPPPVARELKPGFARRIVAPPPLLPRVAILPEVPLRATQTMSDAVEVPLGSSRLPRTTSISSQRTQPDANQCSISSTVVLPRARNHPDIEREKPARRPPVHEQPHSLKRDDSLKQLLVELDTNSTAKSSCDKSKKLPAAHHPPSKSNNSNRRISGDSDHVLIEISDGKAKPGEHSYPCPRCGKCMCPYCKGGNRHKSSKNLLCGGRCLCNTDSVIDTLTCFCCVRACFYHCSNRDKDELCTVKPCSCQESNRCARWGSIIALTPVLPCLLCYPVARGCVRMCNVCSECLQPGCKCKESNR